MEQVKAEVSLTSATLEETRTFLAREGAARSQLDEEVSALRLDRERDIRDLRAGHSAELTLAREEGVRRAEEAAAARATEVRQGVRARTLLRGTLQYAFGSNLLVVTPTLLKTQSTAGDEPWIFSSCVVHRATCWAARAEWLISTDLSSKC